MIPDYAKESYERRKPQEIKRWKGMSAIQVIKQTLFIKMSNGDLVHFSRDYSRNEEAEKNLLYNRRSSTLEFEKWFEEMIQDRDTEIIAMISGKPANISKYGFHLKRMAQRAKTFEETIREKKLKCYYFTGRELQPIVSNKQFEYYINTAPDKVFFVK